MFSCRIDDDAELRLFEQHHAEELFAVIDENREHLREWLPWVDPTTSVDVSLSFIKISLEQFAAGEGFAAGIWYKGRIVGCVGTHKIDRQNRKVEIGYWLTAAAQGKGLITRACRAVLNRLFNEHGLHRVEIHCAIDNLKSRRVPQRLGFTEEAILKQAHWQHDRFVDLVIYAMLKEQWNSSR